MKRILQTLALAALGLAPLAQAQNITSTYQGRVTSGGSPFTGAGQFKFALVTSTDSSAPATATATVSFGFVVNIAVTTGGNGYVTPPVVTISGGGGSGAMATAIVSGGMVTGFNISPNGSGYTSAPTVTVAPPPPAITYVTYWSNDGTSVAGSEPTAAVSASVASGLFTVALGDTTLANMMPLGAGQFTRPGLQLRIWFNDGVNGFAALNPAQNLTAAPSAAFAHSASNLLGALPDAGLSANVALRAGGNAFTGNQTIMAGNVGIGTANPTDALEVNGGFRVSGSSTASTGAGVEIDYATVGPRIFAVNRDTSTFLDFGIGDFTSDKGVMVKADGKVGIGTVAPAAKLDIRPIAFANDQNGGIQLAAAGGQWPSGMFLRSDSGGQPRLAFVMNSGEGLSIHNGGNVGIGTTSPGAKLDVNGTAIIRGGVLSMTGPSTHAIEFFHPGVYAYKLLSEGTFPGRSLVIADTGTGTRIDRLTVNPFGVGIGRPSAGNRLEVEGDASKTAAGSWFANSDARIKTDIKPITSALDKIEQVRLVQFHYTDDYRAAHPAIEDRAYLNVVAQEFQKVFPEHVKRSGEKLPNGDDILQVDSYPLTIYSAAAVQELNSKLKAKDAELRELQQRMTALEKLLRRATEAQDGGAR